MTVSLRKNYSRVSSKALSSAQIRSSDSRATDGSAREEVAGLVQQGEGGREGGDTGALAAIGAAQNRLTSSCVAGLNLVSSLSDNNTE